jgi:cytoskeletal protein RodZ
MHEVDKIERALRERYPRPSVEATERTRAAVAGAVKGQEPQRPQRRRRLVALAVAVVVVGAGAAAAWVAFRGNASAHGPRVVRALNVALTSPATTAARSCPVRTGAGAYDTTLNPTSGPPGSTVTVSGPLPVISEDGTNVGQTSTEVDVYWNLNFDKWWSVLGNSPSPLASVAGSPVKLLGTQDVSKLCTYQVQVTIPPVAPGTYPIEVLNQAPGHEAPNGGGTTFATFAPTDFQVTGG